jgi:hypothetical protein
MKKQIFITALLVFFLISSNFAQEDAIKDIRKKYQEIVKGEGYTTEEHFLECYTVSGVSILVKKKDGEVRLIEFASEGSRSEWCNQYFYWKDKVFFVYLKDCYTDTDDEGIAVNECTEHRHYYKNKACIKSLFKEWSKVMGEEDKPLPKNTIIDDYKKANSEFDKANKYYEWSKTDSWKKLCE